MNIAISRETGDLDGMSGLPLCPGSPESHPFRTYLPGYSPTDTIPTPEGMKKVFLGDKSEVTEGVRIVTFMGVWHPESETGVWARFEGEVSGIHHFWNGRSNAIRYNMITDIVSGSSRIVWTWTARPDMWVYVAI